jgi:hypothetical protein
LCHTDSLIESKDRGGEFLGLGGLLRIARTIDGSRPAKVIPSLLSAIAEEYPGNLTQDDVTLLLFRPSGRDDAGFLQRLYAPFRLLGGVARAVTRGERPPLPEWNPAIFAGAVVPLFNRLWRPRSGQS